MTQKTALIMAGGTGGHIFPGLAVAEELRARGWRVHWLGAPGSMEKGLEVMREEATKLGYHLMMTTIAKSEDGTARSHIVGSLLIDALLVVITEQDDPLAEDVLASGVPTVVLDTDMSAQGLDSVILDNDGYVRTAHPVEGPGVVYNPR